MFRRLFMRSKWFAYTLWAKNVPFNLSSLVFMFLSGEMSGSEATASQQISSCFFEFHSGAICFPRNWHFRATGARSFVRSVNGSFKRHYEMVINLWPFRFVAGGEFVYIVRAISLGIRSSVLGFIQSLLI